MGWTLILVGVFVLGLVIGALMRRGHGWLLLFGPVAGLTLWMIGARGDHYENFEGASGLAAYVIALLVGAWSIGLGAGYLIRRIPPGSV